jgi:hypothetical protein
MEDVDAGKRELDLAEVARSTWLGVRRLDDADLGEAPSCEFKLGDDFGGAFSVIHSAAGW